VVEDQLERAERYVDLDLFADATGGLDDLVDERRRE
jgi:hypothetical protein